MLRNSMEMYMIQFYICISRIVIA